MFIVTIAVLFSSYWSGGTQVTNSWNMRNRQIAAKRTNWINWSSLLFTCIQQANWINKQLNCSCWLCLISPNILNTVSHVLTNSHIEKFVLLFNSILYLIQIIMMIHITSLSQNINLQLSIHWIMQTCFLFLYYNIILNINTTCMLYCR